METINIAGIAGTISKAPEKLESLYGRKNLYRAYIDVSRRSGVSDEVIVIYDAAAVDEEANVFEEGTQVIFTGALQTMRNTETGQIDTFILADYIRAGFAQPQDNVKFTGIIARQPHSRTTPKGKRITDLMIKTASKFENSFYCVIPVIAWGDTATAAAMLAEGTEIEIEGRLQSRTYNKTYEDGRTELKTTTEVSANSIKTEEYKKIAAEAMLCAENCNECKCSKCAGRCYFECNSGGENPYICAADLPIKACADFATR